MSIPSITTAIPTLVLRDLTIHDEKAYYALVDANRAHLSQHGDYSELKDATIESIHADLANAPKKGARFGGWHNGELVGRFDLVAHERGNFVLGYWLGQKYTGQGLATAGCEALIKYGSDHLSATDIWAGVTKGNDASIAVLNRLGLDQVKDMGSYIRYHKKLLSSPGQL